METVKRCKLTVLSFFLCLAVSIFLMIGGAITPPPFQIDGSIFTAVGWLFAFAALGQLPELINSAKTIRIFHGKTKVEVNPEDNEIKNEDEDGTSD